MVSTDLSGRWRAAPADDDLRRDYAGNAFDDRDWADVDVPGHWATSPLGPIDGPVLYRRPFHAPAPQRERRRWLRLDGVFSQGDVWLDGTYVGDTDGYFFPHVFDVTEVCAARDDHVLAVEVSSPGPGELAAKRTLTGAFAQGDLVAPGTNPGGIWRPVQLIETGPVGMRAARLRCADVTSERATLAIRLVVDADRARPIRLRTRACGVEHHLEHALATGSNRIEWKVNIRRPARWWPHALGPQILHDVVVDVLVAAEGDDDTSVDDTERHETVSDSRRWRTGLRSVQLRNWHWYVNGERLFVKGACIGPARADLGNATAAELVADLDAAKEAGLDLVRVHTHVSRPELYAAADERGLLVWQDLPLHRRYSRGVRKQAASQARAAVDLLGHHPSVALWCAHNEPFSVDEQLEPTVARQGFGRTAVAKLRAQQLPSWNRTVLDSSVKRELERADGTRPVIAHSGVLPHLPLVESNDTHLWFGWYEHDVDELAAFAARWPRAVRFVSELGAQAVPDSAEFCDALRWPDLDWERLVAEHGCQTAVFDRVVSPDDYATFDEWRDATQRHQATVVQHTIELLRRIKYRPTGGFCVYRLSDNHPAISFSLIDHERRPKLAYAALREACRPVIVVADPLPPTLAPGELVEVGVYVVNDTHQPIEGAQVRARVEHPDGVETHAWAGDVEADRCAHVATLSIAAPARSGPLALDLELTSPTGGTALAANRYASTVR